MNQVKVFACLDWNKNKTVPKNECFLEENEVFDYFTKYGALVRVEFPKMIPDQRLKFFFPVFDGPEKATKQVLHVINGLKVSIHFICICHKYHLLFDLLFSQVVVYPSRNKAPSLSPEYMPALPQPSSDFFYDDGPDSDLPANPTPTAAALRARSLLSDLIGTLSYKTSASQEQMVVDDMLIFSSIMKLRHHYFDVGSWASSGRRSSRFQEEEEGQRWIYRPDARAWGGDRQIPGAPRHFEACPSVWLHVGNTWMVGRVQSSSGPGSGFLRSNSWHCPMDASNVAKNAASRQCPAGGCCRCQHFYCASRPISKAEIREWRIHQSRRSSAGRNRLWQDRLHTASLVSSSNAASKEEERTQIFTTQ